MDVYGLYRPVRKVHIALNYMFYLLYCTEYMGLNKTDIVKLHQQIILLTNKC